MADYTYFHGGDGWSWTDEGGVWTKRGIDRAVARDAFDGSQQYIMRQLYGIPGEEPGDAGEDESRWVSFTITERIGVRMFPSELSARLRMCGESYTAGG
jgi:hypothetical protein